MADKDFGVKRINLISNPGTPAISIGTSTITYEGILGLNASTVAISTDVSIGGNVVSNIVVSNGYSVGIGTTVLTEKLNVSGNVNILGVVSATGFIGSGVSLTGLLSNQLGTIDQNSYQYLLVTKNSSGTISSISATPDLLVFNPVAKYLGIGTGLPGANLDVVGTGNFSGTVTAPTFLGTATTASGLTTNININTSGIITATKFVGPIEGTITGTASTANNLSDAANITTGTISSSRLSGTYPISITGTATTATTASGLTTNININTSGIITASSFTGNLTGTATTTTQLQNTRYFSVSGDVSTGSSVAFNGTENVGLAVTLALSGVTSGTYGSSTSIPSISVNNKGIITGVSTTGITVGNGTLDLKTSGTGLSGTAIFTANQATGTAVTFTVASNAASANTANAIVSRDASGNFYAGIITATTFSGTATTANNVSSTININTSGIVTANTFSTGISTQNIGFTTGLISGPNTIFISPYKIGISTGNVRILGNLTVDGTTFTTTQQTIESSAKTIGVAVSETSNIVLDGSGITIGSTSIQKTLFWNYGSSALKSSENFNLANGKVYQINDNQVLSSTALAPSVTTASGITSVGTLQQLIVSGNTSTEAVKIIQSGSGNALIINDDTNQDSTPFIVNATGSVGIGTTNPTQKLHIQGDLRVTGGLYDSNNSVGTASSVLVSTGAGVSWKSISTAALQGLQGLQGTQGLQGLQGLQGRQGLQGLQGTAGFVGAQGLQGLQGRQGLQGLQGLQGIFGPVAGSANQVIYKNSSNVAIGSDNLTFNGTNLTVSGSVSAGDFTSTSDINLKTNIQQFDESLSKVIQIRGVTFDWKERNGSSAGVIAQEVEKVLPELVSGEDIKKVNYNGIIGALIEAIKELKIENDILKERLDEVYKKVFG